MESKFAHPSRLVAGLLLFVSLVAAFLVQPLKAGNYDSRLYASAAKQQAFATQIEAILKAERDTNIALRHYQIAKRATGKDPRSDYAMGLILFNQFEYDKAGTQFEAAAKNEHAAYLPAWQAVIVLDLMQSNRESLLADTLKLAKLAADDRVEWIGADQSQAAAAWLGEVDAFLELPDVAFLADEELSEHLDQMQQAISPSLFLNWALGKQKFHRKHQAFKQDIDRQQQQVKDQMENTSDKRTAKLDQNRKEIEQKKDATQRSAAEWKAWYDKQMDQTKKQFDLLQRDYAMLDTVAKRLSAIILRTQFEVGQTESLVNRDARSRRRRGGLSTNQVALGQREQDLLRYRLQYFALEQRGMQLMAQARQVMMARQSAANRYQQATGEITKRDQALTRWNNMVQKSTLKAVAKANDTDAIEALEKRLTTATSYFPLDFETEKDRLLKSFPHP